MKLKNKKRVLKSFWEIGVGFGAGEKDLFTKRAFPPPQFPMPLLPGKLLFFSAQGFLRHPQDIQPDDLPDLLIGKTALDEPDGKKGPVAP